MSDESTVRKCRGGYRFSRRAGRPCAPACVTTKRAAPANARGIARHAQRRHGRHRTRRRRSPDGKDAPKPASTAVGQRRLWGRGQRLGHAGVKGLAALGPCGTAGRPPLTPAGRGGPERPGRRWPHFLLSSGPRGSPTGHGADPALRDGTRLTLTLEDRRPPRDLADLGPRHGGRGHLPSRGPAPVRPHLPSGPRPGWLTVRRAWLSHPWSARSGTFRDIWAAGHDICVRPGGDGVRVPRITRRGGGEVRHWSSAGWAAGIASRPYTPSP